MTHLADGYMINVVTYDLSLMLHMILTYLSAMTNLVDN